MSREGVASRNQLAKEEIMSIPASTADLKRAAAQRILVLDGAMAPRPEGQQ
jgi:hypothetical protein